MPTPPEPPPPPHKGHPVFLAPHPDKGVKKTNWGVKKTRWVALETSWGAEETVRGSKKQGLGGQKNKVWGVKTTRSGGSKKDKVWGVKKTGWGGVKKHRSLYNPIYVIYMTHIFYQCLEIKHSDEHDDDPPWSSVILLWTAVSGSWIWRFPSPCHITGEESGGLHFDLESANSWVKAKWCVWCMGQICPLWLSWDPCFCMIFCCESPFIHSGFLLVGVPFWKWFGKTAFDIQLIKFQPHQCHSQRPSTHWHSDNCSCISSIRLMNDISCSLNSMRICCNTFMSTPLSWNQLISKQIG